MRGDQVDQIRKMASEGRGINEIATAVGLEIGDVASVVASVTLGAGEGGSNVSVRLVSFPFAHNAPGLASGVVAYRPRVGEVLLLAWFSIGEGWDGTTPQGSFGPAASFTSPPPPFQPGIMQPLDMTIADRIEGGLAQPSGSVWPVAGGVVGGSPSVFMTTDVLVVVVSRDGTLAGGDPGATRGHGALNLLIADPH